MKRLQNYPSNQNVKVNGYKAVEGTNQKFIPSLVKFNSIHFVAPIVCTIQWILYLFLVLFLIVCCRKRRELSPKVWQRSHSKFIWNFTWSREQRTWAGSMYLAIQEGTSDCNLCRHARRYNRRDGRLSLAERAWWCLASKQVLLSYSILYLQHLQLVVLLLDTLIQLMAHSLHCSSFWVHSIPSPCFITVQLLVVLEHNDKPTRKHLKYLNPI